MIDPRNLLEIHLSSKLLILENRAKKKDQLEF